VRKNNFFFHGTLSTKTLRIDCDWYVQKTNLKDSGIEGKQYSSGKATVLKEEIYD